MEGQVAGMSPMLQAGTLRTCGDSVDHDLVRSFRNSYRRARIFCVRLRGS